MASPWTSRDSADSRPAAGGQERSSAAAGPARPAAAARPRPRGLRRGALLCLGWASFALGVVGVALPVVPTTPFMLVALWAFSMSSERFHSWLYHHRLFGPPLQRWEREHVVPRWAKALSLGTMAASFGYAALVRRAPWWLLLPMGALMLFGALYVLRFPSRPRGPGAR